MIIVLVDSTVVYNDPLCPRYKRERTKPPLDPAKTPADLLKKKKKIIFACFKGVNGQKAFATPSNQPSNMDFKR